MNKLKVMTILGTRPEIIRLSRVIVALAKHFDHTLVHTGQNYDYELNQVFFDDLGLPKPDYFLNAASTGNKVAETIGNIIIEVDNILAEVKPDAILVLGDTNSCLSIIPAKKRKIPIFHMEAGNRCFDQRVPEEINRRIVDHTADINLTYSSIAREYLLSEGLPPDQIIKTGSPMYEVITHNLPRVKASDILSSLKLNKNFFFVVSLHREENIESESSFLKLVKTINAVAETYELPVIFSTHPRTLNRIKTLNIKFNEKIKILKPLGFYDYLNLQINAKAVLSDSGTISEEASILNFPALNLREVHERPEAMEGSAVMMTGLEGDRVMQGLNILERQMSEKKSTQIKIDDYSIPDVSEKIVRIIHSYTDYVNRVVWKKY